MCHLDGRANVTASLPCALESCEAGYEKPSLGVREAIDDVALLRVIGNEAPRTSVFLPFAGRHETEEEAPRRLLLRRRQPSIRSLCHFLDRTGDPADRCI